MDVLGIGFDFDHTLGIDNKLERIAFLRLLGRVIAEGGAVSGTLTDESDRIDALLAHQRGGACSIEEAIREFVGEHGVTPARDHVTFYKNVCLMLADEIVVPLPGVSDMLEQLRRRGIPHAILSNGWSPLQERKARMVGFTETVLTSGSLGFQKPDPRAFAALAEALAVPMANLVYVGDDPVADVAGALGAGVGSAVWLDAEGRTYPPDLPKPTHTIAAMAAVLDLL